MIEKKEGLFTMHDYFEDEEELNTETEVYLAKFSFSLESDKSEDYENVVKILEDAGQRWSFLSELPQGGKIIDGDSEEFKFQFVENKGKKEIIADMKYTHEYDYTVDEIDYYNQEMQCTYNYGQATEEAPVYAAEFINELLNENGIKAKTDKSGDMMISILSEKHFLNLSEYEQYEKEQISQKDKNNKSMER